MKKRLVSLLLACLIILAVAAPALAEAEMVGNMYVSGFPVLKEKETYTIAVTKDPSSLNSFADKECVKYTNELTNIDIEWLDIPAASWSEQVNIMIAGNNLPDAFLGKDVDIMANQEMFQPLTEAIYAYCPNIVEMLEADPRIKGAITAPNDGEIYCLPTNKDNPSSTVDGILWVNPDWLEAVGMEMPTTTDEFVEMLRAFKTQDPNGNGIADEIPLQAEQDTSSRWLQYLLGSFGAIDNSEHVYSVDGETVVFGPTQPGYFEGLKWLHELYAEGLIAEDVFTIDTAQLTAKGQQEDTVFGSIMYWIPDAIDARYADWETMEPLAGPDGTRMWVASRAPLGAMKGFSITTECENPEVLLRYYDTCLSSFEMIMIWQWGPEGAGCWKRVPEEGEFAWSQTMEFVPADMSQEYFKRTSCGSIYSPNYLWSKWANYEVADMRNAKKRAANQAAMPYCAEAMPNGLDDPDRANEINLLKVDIDNYVERFFATSVVDGITEEQWEEHLVNCQKLRVEEYVALWQEYYTEKKA